MDITEDEIFHELQITQAANRLRIADVSAEDRETVKDMIGSSSYSFLNEEKLWREWRNILVRLPVKDFSEVEEAPSRAYREWVGDRLLDPYAISRFNLVRLLNVPRYTPEFVNEFALCIWPVEIAWARYLRRSEKDRTAVVSRLFLDGVVRDPWNEIQAVAESFIDAMGNLSFVMARERSYSEAEIRSGYGDGDFVPAFLRYAEAAYVLKIQKIPPEVLSALADKARSEERQEMAAFASTRAAQAVRKSPLSRIPGIIAVAIECRMSSDDLVWAEKCYVEALDKGEITVSFDTRYPHAEFVEYLRALPRSEKSKLSASQDLARIRQIIETHRDGRSPLAVGEDGIEIPASEQALSRQNLWLDALPHSFKNLEAKRRQNFDDWSQALLFGKKLPYDLVVDYGMYLQKLRTTADFKARAQMSLLDDGPQPA